MPWCDVYQKRVDNLDILDGMQCCINSRFKYGASGPDVDFKYGTDNGVMMAA